MCLNYSVLQCDDIDFNTYLSVQTPADISARYDEGEEDMETAKALQALQHVLTEKPESKNDK